MKKHLLVFGLIFTLLLAGLLYFYKLLSIPNGVYVDEATDAYNSYSIFKTGKDEYGVTYPVVFRLLGSYTPSAFIYLCSYLIKYFGFEITLFRSVTAISVLVSVVFFYLLITKMDLLKSKLTYFLITLLFAICPWMVFNARVGYETTFGFVVFSIGIYFLFLCLKNIKNSIPAIIFLSISTYVSHNERYLAPLFIVAFLILFAKKILVKKNLKTLLIALILGVILHIPNFMIIDTHAFWIKNAQFNPQYLGNIIVYFSPKTLFYKLPDIDMQHTLPKISLYYNWMVIPYLIGLYIFIKNIKDDRNKFIALYLVAPLLPAVVSSAFISEQKILPMIVPLTIIIGLGLDAIVVKINSNIIKLGLVSALLVYSLIMLYSSYFVLFPKERAWSWNYGYDNLANYIQKRPDKKFLLDDTRNPRAYILLLYHLKYDPAKYQQEVDSYYKENYYSAPIPALEYSFSNVEVRQINWEKDPKKDLIIIGDNLTISDSQAKQHNLTKIDEIKGITSDTDFYFYKTQPAK